MTMDETLSAQILFRLTPKMRREVENACARFGAGQGEVVRACVRKALPALTEADVADERPIRRPPAPRTRATALKALEELKGR